MGKKLALVTKETSYHGNAGIASAFVALGNRKLKPGGVLALVLPLTAAVGLSWQDFRRMLTGNYPNIDVLSIAASKGEMSFSSDTGMGECLVIARKTHGKANKPHRIEFTSLSRRTPNFASASAIASSISRVDWVRPIEEGPIGGTRLFVGTDQVGEMLTASYTAQGEPWSGVRISDCSVAQTAYALSISKLWLPSLAAARKIKTVPLNEFGRIGLVHHDINGPPPRGPFSKLPPSPTATYPCLWNHDAKKETKLVCNPDSQLEVRQGMNSKAALAWETASRAHINRDFTFGSQALAIAFTERYSMGGRVWPNVILGDEKFDYALAVWGNCTLGMLSYWWHSSRQQSSKAGITVRAAETLPVLDFRELSDERLTTAERIFDEFRELDLMPAYLADADPNRALLDRRVICDLLGFDEDVYRGVRRLAAKWCAEPSVHGGKKRPKGAGLVI